MLSIYDSKGRCYSEDEIAAIREEMESRDRCIELERKLLQLKVAGGALANCAYNLSQQAGEPLLQRHADSLKRAYEHWDRLIRSNGQ